MKKIAFLALLCTASLTVPAWAHEGMDMGHAHVMPVAAMAAATDEWADGVIRTVDKTARKLTIKHGEIKNLDMMPMTMVFHVADPALLDKVKAGDAIRFTASEEKGTLVVKKLERVQK